MRIILLNADFYDPALQFGSVLPAELVASRSGYNRPDCLVHKIIQHHPVRIECLCNLLELGDAFEKLRIMLLVLKRRERWRHMLAPMEASLYSNMSGTENVYADEPSVIPGTV